MTAPGPFSENPLVLLVEDDPISCDVLGRLLEAGGIDVIAVDTGEAAWTQIKTQGERIDTILLDRLLPDMDSLELLQRLKHSPDIERIPVIMQTMLDSNSDIAEGLEAGAYYYQTKPIVPETLLAIVRAAIQERRDYRVLQQSLRQSHRTFRNLHMAEFGFRTMNDARDLATMAAHASGEPERTVLGLTELMYNAIEHGNLGITYAEKTALLAGQTFVGEVESRLARPEFAGRMATLRIERLAGETRFTIRDQGNGFDWTRYLELSPERAFDTHGRGIAMASMLSFDAIEYRGSGNEVVCRIFDSPPPTGTDTATSLLSWAD